jgi:hypothetical protein
MCSMRINLVQACPRHNQQHASGLTLQVELPIEHGYSCRPGAAERPILSGTRRVSGSSAAACCSATAGMLHAAVRQRVNTNQDAPGRNNVPPARDRQTLGGGTAAARASCRPPRSARLPAPGALRLPFAAQPACAHVRSRPVSACMCADILTLEGTLHAPYLCSLGYLQPFSGTTELGCTHARVRLAPTSSSVPAMPCLRWSGCTASFWMWHTTLLVWYLQNTACRLPGSQNM